VHIAPEQVLPIDDEVGFNGDIGLIPLFSEFENVVTRENVHGYVSYPDGIPVLSKLSLG
jgi:hypothetical protein